MHPGRFLRALALQSRGAAALEFAILAPVLFTLLLGGLEAGHTMYVKAVLDGEMQKAARDTSLEDGGSATRQAVIKGRVESMVKTIIGSAVVTWRQTSYHDYRNAQNPAEEYVDANHDGLCDAGEAYVDANNNGHWDADTGEDGTGSAKDVVLMTATVTYPRLLIGRIIGNDDVVLTSSTLLRNQPSDDQAATPQRNCS